MQIIRFLLLARALSFAVLGLTVEVSGLAHEKRAACNEDNALRALQHNSVSASPFCQTYINIPTTTSFVKVAGITHVTSTQTATSYLNVYPNSAAFAAVELPTYILGYPPTRISSACSCLSVPPTTETITASYSTVYVVQTVTSTTTLTGPCATGTVDIGAFNISSPASNPYITSLSGETALNCCGICNSGGGEGPFASCIAWYYSALLGTCSLLDEGIDYLQPPCTRYGLQPGIIDVNAALYPYNLGGRGQCASTIQVVNSG